MMAIRRRDLRLAFFFSALLFLFDRQGAQVQITCAPLQVTARQGEKVILNFAVRNLSAFKLDQVGNFFLSYHVRDLSGRLVRFDNRRFSLPFAVKPGSTVRFALPAYFSLAAGTYRLEWDLVREGNSGGGIKIGAPVFSSCGCCRWSRSISGTPGCPPIMKPAGSGSTASNIFCARSCATMRSAWAESSSASPPAAPTRRSGSAIRLP